MSKNEILIKFEDCFKDPGSEKSGEYLEEHIIEVVRGLINTDRKALISIFQDWLNLRKDPETMLAVNIAKKFKLRELNEGIQQLLDDINDKKVFLPYYGSIIQKTLDEINK
jgi:hypothetical protein